MAVSWALHIDGHRCIVKETSYHRSELIISYLPYCRLRSNWRQIWKAKYAALWLLLPSAIEAEASCWITGSEVGIFARSANENKCN